MLVEEKLSRQIHIQTPCPLCGCFGAHFCTGKPAPPYVDIEELLAQKIKEWTVEKNFGVYKVDWGDPIEWWVAESREEVLKLMEEHHGSDYYSVEDHTIERLPDCQVLGVYQDITLEEMPEGALVDTRSEIQHTIYACAAEWARHHAKNRDVFLATTEY